MYRSEGSESGSNENGNRSARTSRRPRRADDGATRSRSITRARSTSSTNPASRPISSEAMAGAHAASACAITRRVHTGRRRRSWRRSGWMASPRPRCRRPDRQSHVPDVCRASARPHAPAGACRRPGQSGGAQAGGPRSNAPARASDFSLRTAPIQSDRTRVREAEGVGWSSWCASPSICSHPRIRTTFRGEEKATCPAGTHLAS